MVSITGLKPGRTEEGIRPIERERERENEPERGKMEMRM